MELYYRTRSKTDLSTGYSYYAPYEKSINLSYTPISRSVPFSKPISSGKKSEKEEYDWSKGKRKRFLSVTSSRSKDKHSCEKKLNSIKKRENSNKFIQTLRSYL